MTDAVQVPLSWRAQGILGWALTHKWRAGYFAAHELMKYGRDGRQATYSGLKELCDAGYLSLAEHLVDNKPRRNYMIIWDKVGDVL